MPVDIEGRGWELRVTRLGLQHRHGERVRTYGAYQLFIDGQPIVNLAGHTCECTGPGDNTVDGTREHLRIEEGRYSLSTQFGSHFHSVGFTANASHPMPGFLVLGTAARSGILVHPGHPPELYLSSIGCINLTKPLTASQDMDFTDSRGRVVALLASLKQHDPHAFAIGRIGHDTVIVDAFLVVDGEPMTPVREDVVA